MKRFKLPFRPAAFELKLSRRSVLQLFGSGAMGAGLGLEGCASDADDLEILGQLSEGLVEPTNKVELVRAADLLVLKLGLLNVSTGNGRMKRATAGSPSYLVLELPQQAIVEDAYEPQQSVPARSTARLSGKSRLLVQLPSDFSDEEFSVANVVNLLSRGQLVIAAKAQALSAGTLITRLPLAWDWSAAALDRALADDDAGAALRLRQRRLGAAAPPPSSPAIPSNILPTELEIPFRVKLSPGPGTAWGAAREPVKSPRSQRIEVWNTYLGVRDAATGVVSAAADAMLVGALDPLSDPSMTQVKLPTLSSQKRTWLAEATTGPSGRAARARQLVLSSLGGYLDVSGKFDQHPSLKSWVHKIAQGREQFVETIVAGRLLPFGHPAVIVSVSFRSDKPKLSTEAGAANAVGTLRTYDLVVVKEPIASYATETTRGDEAEALRRFPFAAVRLHETRVLAAAGTTTWIKRLGTTSKGKFAASGYDQRGREIHFETELYFVPNSITEPPADFKTFSLKLNGQRVAYAPSQTDDTSFETQTLSLSLQPYAQRAFRVLPRLDEANVVVESLKQMGFENDGKFTIAEEYAVNGFGGVNAAGMLLLAPKTSGVLDVGGTLEGSSNLVKPKLGFDAISKKAGPVLRNAIKVDPANLAASQFDPKTAFSGAGMSDVKLFGVFELKQILTPILSSEVLGGDPMRFAPRVVTDMLQGAERVIATIASMQQAAAMLDSHADELQAYAQEQLRDLAGPALDKVNAIITALGNLRDAAKKFYEAGEAALALVQSGDFEHLADTSSNGALPKLIQALDAMLTRFDELQQVAGTDGKFRVVDGIEQELQRAVDEITKAFGTVDKTLSRAEQIIQQVQNIAKLAQNARKGLQAARDLAVKLDWRPKINKFNVACCYFVPESKHGLHLQIEIRAKAQGGKPAGTDLAVRLDRFKLLLGKKETDPELTAKFRRFILRREAGKKVDVDVVFDGLEFGGALKFVETIKNAIPLDGFSDPPYLDVNAQGITAGFTIAIPSIAVGMFSIENIKFGAELFLPFIGEAPVLSFMFCDADNPFLVTYAMLGGGGYFRLSLTPDGLKSIELSMNISAQIALAFAVASGSVSISAGLTMTLSDNEVALTAFIRLHGEAEVLGILSISIDIRLELTFKSTEVRSGCKKCTLVGAAEMRVSVHLFMFHAHVTLRFEYEFVGSNADPTLVDVMSPYRTEDAFALSEGIATVYPWEEYCEAYA